MLLHERYVKETRNERGEITKVSYDIPDDFNFAYDVVDKLAAEKPGKRAIMWCSEQGGEKDISFGEIKEMSDRTAAFLKTLGIGRGDKVMLILKRHYEFWYAAMALHKLGACGIPATNQLQAKDIVYRMNNAGVKAVICTGQGDIAAHVDKAHAESPTLEHKILVNGEGKREGWLDFYEGLSNAPAFVRPTGQDAPKSADMMLLYFTSGTTGMPKMVVHDFTYPVAHIVTAKLWHQVDPDGLHLTVAETGWAKSVWGKLYGQWFMEAAIFVYDYDRFDAGVLLTMMGKYKVTTFCAPPTMYRFFIKSDLSKFDLSHLKHVTIAGEALNPEVYEQFKNATGLKLSEGFGQTETTLTVLTPYWMEPKPGSMGKPSPAYDVFVADENGEQARPGVVGEIVVSTKNEKPCGMFNGYFNNDELTSSVWHDGLYHTGDMAWSDEDGYFWYVGRDDDLIKSSGYRIGPFEVESVLMEHPGVLECAVTGVPDPVRGQLVKATIVLAKGYEATDVLMKEIQDYVKTHTAPYKYPRIIEFVPELPKTISGKIKRAEIRKG